MTALEDWIDATCPIFYSCTFKISYPCLGIFAGRNKRPGAIRSARRYHSSALLFAIVGCVGEQERAREPKGIRWKHGCTRQSIDRSANQVGMCIYIALRPVRELVLCSGNIV